MHSQEDLPPCQTPSEGFALVVDGYMSTSLIIGGIVGNSYCVKVLFSTSINTGMLVSLTALAVWDVILLMTSLFHHSLWATLHSLNLQKHPWDPFIVSLANLLECAHLASTWTLLQVSLTRFFAVSRPFQQFSHHRKRRQTSFCRALMCLLKIPLFITAAAIVCSIPTAFEYNLKPCLQDGEEFYQMEETSLKANPRYELIYRVLFLSVLKTIGPFSIITVLTLSTMTSMRKSMDNRASILIEQGQGHLFEADKDKTKSLQAISSLLLIKFFILRCFPTLIAVFRMLTNAQHSTYLAHVAEFLLLLNSATNSLVIVLLKSAFETRRLRRIRQRQRELVAKHAAQVLFIGRALAGENLMLISDTEDAEPQQNSFESSQNICPMF